MTDQERNEISGRLYALELLVVTLLDERIRRLPDKGKDVEHLNALVGKMEQQFVANAPTMSPEVRMIADKKIQELIRGSISVYWGG